MKLELFRQIGEKYSITNCHKNPSSVSRVAPCGRTDRQTVMTKLIVAFQNFANVPNKGRTSMPSAQIVLALPPFDRPQIYDLY